MLLVMLQAVEPAKVSDVFYPLEAKIVSVALKRNKKILAIASRSL